MVSTLAGTGCGDTSDGDVAASPPTSGTEATAVDQDAFCAAVEALDQTDGTTDEAIVLDVIDELRRTAPSEIRDDVDIALVTLIVNNYPGGVEPDMVAASIEDSAAAGAWISAFVEERCDQGT